MSPWLLNIFFDSEVIQVNLSAAGRGVKLRNENGGGLETIQVLHADDTVKVAETG